MASIFTGSIIVIAFSVWFGFKNSDYIEYFIDDLKNNNDIGAIALGSSSIINLPLEHFENCSNFLNRGFGGGTLDKIFTYLNLQSLSRSVKLVIVYAGENDIVYGEDVDQVISQFDQLAERLSSEFDQAHIVIIKVKLAPSRSEYHLQFKALNTELEALAKHPRVIVVGSKLSKKVIPKYYLNDGVHLNSNGYRVFLDKVPKEC
ncbi:GDSL-type esterase/lipase family protein [Marinobacter salexigens]|nr:GDSL-type esterase/lipase family protein [Marinobacter salexigens]